MFKNLIIAALSALIGHVITQHRADKRVIELQRKHAQSEHDTFSYAFSGGYDAGKIEGGKQMWIRFMDGERPDSWV